MMRIIYIHLISILLLSCNPVVKEYRDLRNRTAGVAGQDTVSPIWPGSRQAAACLVYEGGLDEHLDMVLPLLRKYGLKASFLLPDSAPTLGKRPGMWRKVQEEGHILDNYALFMALSHEGRVPRVVSGVNPESMPVMHIEYPGSDPFECLREAKAYGSMAILVFRKISGSPGQEGRVLHDSLLNYLDTHRETYWMPAFMELSEYLEDKYIP
jgi:hypothetical protein